MYLTTAATQELTQMHAFFVEWFTGTCARDDALFDERLTSHFAPDFQIIFPNGSTLTRDQLTSQMRKGHGGSPGFAIEIRNVQARPLDSEGTHLLVTYEEWQQNATNSPPHNGRISTAIFRRDEAQPNGLLWLHTHETWLPQP